MNMLEPEMYGVLIDPKRPGLFTSSTNKACLGDLCKSKSFMEKLKSQLKSFHLRILKHQQNHVAF